MTERLNIAVAGSAGRMGRQLIKAAHALGHQVTGGSEAPGSPSVGVDLGILAEIEPLAVTATDQVDQAANGAGVWIDFTIPAATLSALNALKTAGGRAAVIGTTGFNAAQEAEIAAASRDLAIVKAGNFSLGVNLLEALVRQTAARLGSDWDIEIAEAHHRHKVDAPSGTALMLGEAAASGRGEPLRNLKTAPYDGPSAKREA
ncbi:MAG: 4-hydroxy-tetrahydrodipicolinate reductase, partial [Pseudomonadota bacterium]